MLENKPGYSVNQEPVGEEFSDDAYFTARGQDGKEIGNVYGRIEGDSLTFKNLYVHNNSRRIGIGESLLRRLLEWGKERGTKHIKGNFRPVESMPREEIVEWYGRRGIEVTSDDRLKGEID